MPDRGVGRIDRASEREKAEAEKRRRLAEALRANLKRRKATRPRAPDGTAEQPARVDPSPAGED